MANPADIWNIHLNEIDPRILTGPTTQISDTQKPFIDPRTSRVIERPEVNWTGTETKSHIELFKAFPSKSALTRAQHMNGLKALACQQKEILSESDRMLIEEFQSYKPNITLDHSAFHSFVEQYVDARLRERFARPSKEVTEIGRLANNVDFSKYDDKMFTVQTAFQLEDQMNEFARETKHSVEEELNAFGLAKTIHFVSESPMVTVLHKSEEAAKQFLQKDPEVTKTYHSFIGTHGRQGGGVFISSDSIYHILSADLQSAWTMHFRIQSSDSSEPFIYFEAPCQKAVCLSALDLERIGMGVCFKSALTRSFLRSYSFDKEIFLDRIAESADNTLDKGKSPECDSDQEEEEGSRLVIDTGETEAGAETVTPDDHPKLAEEYKLIEFDEYLSKYVKNGHKEALNYIVSRVNLSAGFEDMQLTITSGCDGHHRSENVALSFKIEYKSEFGAQKMSLDELLSEWCSISFTTRINHVLRCRVDYMTSIVMSVNVLTQEEIEAEMNRLYGLKPERLLTRLHNILNLVTRFPMGKYLLDKQQNTTQILVYMETERSACGKTWKELVSAAAPSGTNTSRSVECAIDDQVVTQLHKINSVLPGCIPTLNSSEARALGAMQKHWKNKVQSKVRKRSPMKVIAKKKYKGKKKVKKGGGGK